MPLSDNPQAVALRNDVLQVFDDLDGVHPGFRPAHAKGRFFSGTFTPAVGARSLTKAPHVQRDFTPIIVRLSDFAGVPTVPDNSGDASPRGCAIRFQLGEHEHTDIVAHSAEGFPVRTAFEFVEFLRAVLASGPDAPSPKPIETFLATHPKALEYVQMPKPIPASFAKESFFAVSAFKFISGDGVEQFGRYRILPEEQKEYLDAETAAAKGPDFLFEEIAQRLQNGLVRYRIFVRLAGPGDPVDDSTIQWPSDREEIEFGVITLTSEIPESDANTRRIIFDPIPRIDGIEASADPLFEQRADVYLASGRRRRSATQNAARSAT
jgi:catalase